MFFSIFFGVTLGIIAAWLIIRFHKKIFRMGIVGTVILISLIVVAICLFLLYIFFRSKFGQTLILWLWSIAGWIFGIALFSAIADAIFDLGLWHPKKKR